MRQAARIAELEAEPLSLVLRNETACCAMLGALVGTLEHYPRTHEVAVIAALAVAAKVLGRRKVEQATGRALIEVLAELERD
jgi:hypothetical protein